MEWDSSGGKVQDIRKEKNRTSSPMHSPARSESHLLFYYKVLYTDRIATTQLFLLNKVVDCFSLLAITDRKQIYLHIYLQLFTHAVIG